MKLIKRVKVSNKIFSFLKTVFKAGVILAILLLIFQIFAVPKVFAQQASCAYGTDALGNCLPAPIAPAAPNQSCITGYHNAADGSCVPDSYFGSQNSASSTSIANDGTQSFGNNAKTLFTQGYYIAALASLVLEIVVAAIQFILNMSLTVMSSSNGIGGAIQSAWSIVLSFVNLGFIIGLIIIAFATILHIQNYSMKRILWKLIVAALLVNFSFFIVGAVVETSNLLSNAFLNHIQGGGLATALGNVMNPQAYSGINGTEAPMDISLFNLLSTLMKWLESVFFMIIFTVLMTIVMFGLAGMLLFRLVAIMILAMVSPAAFICWVFPSLQQYWRKWWSELIRWNIFAPVMMFFLYVTITIASTMNQAMPDLSQNSAAQGVAGSVSSVGMVQHGMNLLIILGFLVGGMIAANSFSISGSKFALSKSKQLGGWAGNTIKNRAQRGALRAGTALQRTEWAQKKAENWQKKASESRVWRWAGAGVVGRGISSLGIKQGESLVKEAEKRYKDKTDKEMAMMFSGATAYDKLHILGRLQKNGKLGEIPKEQLDKHIKDGDLEKNAKRFGQEKTKGAVEKSWHANKEYLEAVDNYNEVSKNLSGSAQTKLDALKKELEDAKNELEKARKAPGGWEVNKLVADKAKSRVINATMAVHDFDESDVLNEAKAKMETARKKLDDSYSGEDWNKISPKALMHDQYGVLTTQSVLEHSPSSLNKIMPKVSGKDMPKLTTAVEVAKSQMMGEVEKELFTRLTNAIILLPDKIKLAEANNQTKLVEQLKKIQGKYTTDGNNTINAIKIRKLSLEGRADVLEDLDEDAIDELNKRFDLKNRIAQEKSLNKTLSKRITGWETREEKEEEKEDKKEDKK